ncbi:MAG TPA: GDSL-type esterase/lipase family protein [Vicinamibacterales bacterium]|nr:GDSL-type esterase/lipase family protein [Vicinamibacterales bacterium]
MRLARYFNTKIIAAAIAVAAAAGGCGGAKGPGPTPVIDPPQIACPADITVAEVPVPAIEVTYPAPTTTAGAAPVNVTCAPASGSQFALGETTVACAARDAQAREATCSFRVNVKGFTLTVKKFVTVGDSLTAGENGLPSIVDVPNSYPAKLSGLLATAYPGQDIVVVNRGVSGLKAEELEDRIPGIVNAERPDAVLLMVGYNNLTTPCAPGLFGTAACSAAIDFTAVYGTRDAIRRIKESPAGVKYIFASTLVPPGPTGSKRIDREAILEVNRRIRQHVATERATLVETYPLFQGREAELVSPDGLHLNAAGYQVVAEAFFQAIKATIPQTPQLR